jgi:hypothetical protein
MSDTTSNHSNTSHHSSSSMSNASSDTTQDNVGTGVVSSEFYEGVEIPLAAAVPVDDDTDDEEDGPAKRKKQNKKRTAAPAPIETLSPACAATSAVSTPTFATAAPMTMCDLPSTLDYKDQGRNWSHFAATPPTPAAWRQVQHDLPSTMDYKDQGRSPSEFIAVATPSPTFTASTTTTPCPWAPPTPPFAADVEAAQPIGRHASSGDDRTSNSPSKSTDRRLLYGGLVVLLVFLGIVVGVIVAVRGGDGSSSRSASATDQSPQSQAPTLAPSQSPTLAPTPTPVPCVASGSVCHSNEECCSNVCAGPQLVRVDVGVCVTP